MNEYPMTEQIAVHHGVPWNGRFYNDTVFGFISDDGFLASHAEFLHIRYLQKEKILKMKGKLRTFEFILGLRFLQGFFIAISFCRQ